MNATNYLFSTVPKLTATCRRHHNSQNKSKVQCDYFSAKNIGHFS